MSTNTDPAGFDPEVTGAFRVATLAQKDQEREPSLRAPIESGPALIYVHSDGRTRTLADRCAPGLTNEDQDDRLRELAVARALLVHALRLVDRELNR